jgi:hypothetical protein
MYQLMDRDCPLAHAVNPIRSFVEKKFPPSIQSPGRPPLPEIFSVGDPTFYEFKPHPRLL